MAGRSSSSEDQPAGDWDGCVWGDQQVGPIGRGGGGEGRKGRWSHAGGWDDVVHLEDETKENKAGTKTMRSSSAMMALLLTHVAQPVEEDKCGSPCANPDDAGAAVLVVR